MPADQGGDNGLMQGHVASVSRVGQETFAGMVDQPDQPGEEEGWRRERARLAHAFIARSLLRTGTFHLQHPSTTLYGVHEYLTCTLYTTRALVLSALHSHAHYRRAVSSDKYRILQLLA